jgi:hypothetical protein
LISVILLKSILKAVFPNGGEGSGDQAVVGRHDSEKYFTEM